MFIASVGVVLFGLGSILGSSIVIGVKTLSGKKK